METSKKSGPRGGRPRKISPQDALDRAERVFWRRGLSGSTLEDISDATGLPRASIAATFGDKRALYLAALRQRANAIAAAVERMLSGDEPIAALLDRFFAGALAHYLDGDDGAQGCFLLATALTPARDDPEVAKLLLESIASTERLLRERFEKEGLSNPARRGAQAAATLHYLAIRARAGDDPDSLRSYATGSAAWLTT